MKKKYLKAFQLNTKIKDDLLIYNKKFFKIICLKIYLKNFDSKS